MTISIEEMKILDKAATGGPWEVEDTKDWAYPQSIVRNADGTKITRFISGRPNFSCTVGKVEREEDNAKFVAASRTFVPEAIRVMEVMAKALRFYAHETNYIEYPADIMKEPYVITDSGFNAKIALAAFDALAQGTMKGDGGE